MPEMTALDGRSLRCHYPLDAVREAA